DDRLLCSAAHLDAMVLGAEVAVLLLDRRPSTLHKGGLEPAGALANAIGAPLAGALIAARADAGPRDEMGIGGKAAHVDADLGDDDPCAQGLDAGNRAYLFSGDTKGGDVGLHLPVDGRDGGIEGIDLPEMQAEQKAMVLGDAAARSLAQLRRGGFQPSIGHAGQPVTTAFNRN